MLAIAQTHQSSLLKRLACPNCSQHVEQERQQSASGQDAICAVTEMLDSSLPVLCLVVLT